MATKPTIFEQTPTEPKKKQFYETFFKGVQVPLEVGMNNICNSFCNYKADCLQHNQSPLGQFSRQNMSEQTKKLQFICSEFFFLIPLILKTKQYPATTRTPNLRVQRQLFHLQAKEEATWNMLREKQKKSEEKI